MSSRNRLVMYIVLFLVVIGAIFLIWAIDTGKIFSNADTLEPTAYSIKDINTLPAPDQSIFGEWFGKIAGIFSK